MNPAEVLQKNLEAKLKEKEPDKPVETKVEEPVKEAEKPKVEEPKVEKPKAEEPKTEEPDKKDVDEAPKKEKKIISTPFGDKEVDISEPEKIETMEQLLAEASKEVGTEIKTHEDLLAAIREMKSFPREDYEKAQQEVEEWRMYFNGMPDDLKVVNSTYYKKGDYRKEMEGMLKDNIYLKPSSDFEKQELVLMYNSDVSKDDFEEMDERSINALYKAAKSEHDLRHNEIKTKAKEIENIQLETAKNFSKSIDKTLNFLKAKMPKLEAEKLKAVKNDLQKGFSLIDNNQYKEDAAYRIALAKYGEDIVNSVIEQAVKDNQRKIEQEKSKAVEEVIKEKTNDSLKTKSASTPAQNIVEGIKKSSFPFLQKK